MKLNPVWILLFAVLMGSGVLNLRAEEKSLGTHGDFLRSKITSASPLAENEKAELVEFAQGQYQSGVSFKDKWSADWIGFFERTANDGSKGLQAMKEEISGFWSRRREENKERNESSRSDARNLRAKMKAES